jgi:hypothetical protein
MARNNKKRKVSYCTSSVPWLIHVVILSQG